MSFDKQRARDVFGPMLARFQARELPFLNVHTDRPQAYVPESLKRDPAAWARFLFYLCLYMRGGYDSVEAAKRLALAYEQHPELFDERVLSMSEAEIQLIMGGFIQIFRERIGRFWLHNSRVLWRHWAGDPRRLFLNARNHHELYYRLMGGRYRPVAVRLQAEQAGQLPGLASGSIHDAVEYQGFLGFRLKMTSMLGYFLYDAGLVEEEPQLSAPVDFHHLRMYLQTGIIPAPAGAVLRYEHLVAPGIAVAEFLQQAFGLPMHVYGDIMWLWSKLLCSQAPHNRSEEEMLPGGRVVRRSVVPTWDTRDRNAYKKSCGVCAIARFCRAGAPAGPYYTLGNLEVVPRPEPWRVQQFLHTDLFLPRVAPTPAGPSS